MAVAGLPRQLQRHAPKAVDAGIQFISVLQKLLDKKELPISLALRVGVSTGPVVAGVIGRNRLSYDVWGDSVNVASRMESTGEPNKVQVGCLCCLFPFHSLRSRASRVFMDTET